MRIPEAVLTNKKRARRWTRAQVPDADCVAHGGGGSIVDSRQDTLRRPNASKDAGASRTTLVWLDRDEYAVGDHQKFEVRIENVGAVPVEMPFSPHLADLQPVMQAEVPIFGGEVGIWAPETKLVTICLKLRGR